MTALRAFAVVGTRPEAIKLAPLLLEIACTEGEIVGELLSTGQHGEMLDAALRSFDLAPTHRVDVLRVGQSLGALTARCLDEVAAVLAQERPDVVIVQGDTTSAMAAAVAAFQLGIEVVHLEAGLRTHDLRAPHPEEGNRRLIGQIASLHLAPTSAARANLLAEGVAARDVVVTGNTVIDALRWTRSRVSPRQREVPGTSRTLLVTVHRRESWGAGVDAVAVALHQIAEAFPALEILLPLHANPVVRGPLERALGGVRNVVLSDPLDYRQMVSALLGCDLVLTDSGGLQEEAPSLSKPVLVMREATERPEAVDAGCARLVGTNPACIVPAVARLLTDPAAYGAMARVANPYGDGAAAARAVAAIRWRFGAGPAPTDFVPEPA